MNDKFAIVVPTYFRGEDTFKILKRCLDSIFNQTYKNFKIFLIGDDFKELKLLNHFLDQYDKNKLEFINIPIAIERVKYYKDNKIALWSFGGTNARNFGINYALIQGHSWICALDHDDCWNDNHLQELETAIHFFNPDVVFTKSLWGGYVLPFIQFNEKYANVSPIPENTIHSSVCINFLKIALRYVDLFEITGKCSPGDANMWQRIKYLFDQGEIKSILINEITCNHMDEGFEKNKL